jgi:glycosyltransferase involved in cell wall biosynthesis
MTALQTMASYDFSVVIATCNPNPHILSWALDSLERQTLPRERFEVIIVDNNSRKPVADMPAVKDRALVLRIVVESQAGTTPARCRGIEEARAEWIVFLDDDNYIDPDYLEQSLRIIAAEPRLGAFGGIARFLSDAPDAGWAKPLLPYLGVRDYGPDPITSNENKWGMRSAPSWRQINSHENSAAGAAVLSVGRIHWSHALPTSSDMRALINRP